MNKWSRNFYFCKNCQKTDVRHKGHGLCRICYGRSDYHKKSSNKWRSTKKGIDSYRNYERFLKIEAIKYYSDGTMKCKICGFSDIRALSIDHINNDGAQHRKKFHRSISAWLRMKKYPIGYQILCMNCNWIKEHERRKELIKQ